MGIRLGAGPTSPPPAGPLTMSPFPDESPPLVRLEVKLTGLPSMDSVVIERMGADSVWVPVRDAEPALLTVGNTWAGEDVEAPYGVPVQYRVRGAYTVLGKSFDFAYPGLTYTPTGTSREMTLNVNTGWLIHPGRPAVSQPLRKLRSWEPERSTARRGLFEPMYGGTTIAVSRARTAASSGLALTTMTNEQAAALRELFADGQALLLNTPQNLGWGIDTAWISVGDYSVARDLQYLPEQRRVWTIAYDIVSRPVGEPQAFWSYDALAAEEQSYDAAAVNYATYADLNAHRPA